MSWPSADRTMTAPTLRPHLRVLALMVTVAFLAAPLAGCIGGQGGGPADPGAAVDGNGTDETDLPAGVDATDLRPHVHDRWVDASGQSVEEIAVVDRTVTIDAVSQDNPRVIDECRLPPIDGGPLLCLGKSSFFPGTWPDGTGKIIPPGTAQIDVTLQFSQGDFEGLRFYYQHRMSQGQWKPLGEFAPGDTNTIRPVPVQISDDGHASVSAWRFHVEPVGNPTAVPDGQVWYGEGDIQVQIVAHRQDGPLPLEPPHPLFFDNDDPPTDTYRVSHVQAEVGRFAQAGRTHVEQNGCGTSVAGACTPAEANSQGVFWTLSPGYVGTRLGDAEPPAQLSGDHDVALVPPTTRLLAGTVRVEGTSEVPVDVCVRAMSMPEEGPYGLPLECKTFQGGTLEFTVERPVTDREVDSFYTDNTGQNASRWTFLVQIAAPQLAGGTHSTGTFAGSVEAAVFVTQTDQFQMPEWGMDAGGGGA